MTRFWLSRGHKQPILGVEIIKVKEETMLIRDRGMVVSTKTKETTTTTTITITITITMVVTSHSTTKRVLITTSRDSTITIIIRLIQTTRPTRITRTSRLWAATTNNHPIITISTLKTITITMVIIILIIRTTTPIINVKIYFKN